jgi:hypothetical protein
MITIILASSLFATLLTLAVFSVLVPANDDIETDEEYAANVIAGSSRNHRR